MPGADTQGLTSDDRAQLGINIDSDEDFPSTTIGDQTAEELRRKEAVASHAEQLKSQLSNFVNEPDTIEDMRELMESHPMVTIKATKNTCDSECNPLNPTSGNMLVIFFFADAHPTGLVFLLAVHPGRARWHVGDFQA